MKKNLSMFYVSAFFKSQLFLLPVLYLFYLENGLTLGDFYFFQGLIFIVSVLLQFPIGYLGDLISRKKLIIISYMLFLGRIIIWLFFRGYWVVFAGEMLYACSKGIFDAVESPYIYAVLCKSDKSKKMVKAYSKLNFAMSVGTSIASLSGAWLYEKSGVATLLIIEFVLVAMAILCSFFIPNTNEACVKNEKISKNIMFEYYKIFKNCPAKYFILYSGLLVSFSHFFFWSIQPLMKFSMVPVYCFGVMYFINNVLRSLGALTTDKLLSKIDIKKMTLICFILDLIGIISVLFLLSFSNYVLGLSVVFYLSVCITFQLMFTILHISNLQKIAKDEYRTKLSAINMVVARTLAGVLLVIPKYIVNASSLQYVYTGYGILFIVLCVCLIKKINHKCLYCS